MCVRKGYTRGWLVRSKGVDASEYHHCTSNGSEDEEEEKAVGHTEDGKR